jgi:hypothetical protein
MQGLWNVLKRGSLLASGALCLCLTDCSGGAFKSEAVPAGTGGGDAGTGGGTTAGTTDGGRVGSGGSDEPAGSPSETGGSAGTGGVVSSGCNCASGSYCRDASPDCLPCAALNRMKFTAPERIATLSDSGQGSRFPRIGSTSTDLLYRFDGVGLRYTADASTSPGMNLGATEPGDSAPLLLDSSVAGLAGAFKNFNLLFDRAEPGAKRALYFARWNGNLEALGRAPAPFNADLGDYSMAVALHPTDSELGRAFWMSNRNSTEELPAPQLLTAELASDAVAEAVTLRIGRLDCTVADNPAPEAGVDTDLTPWVTSDGKLLLFSTTRLEPNCSAGNQKKDIHSILLRPELGQPPDGATASPLSDVNGPADDTDPSFSADLCDLYFASNRDGKYAVYRAHRR